MSIINKGTSFANGEQLTADKINDLIDLATFNQDATDSQTTDVNSAGQIVVNQGGIDTAQLATGAVTKSKIENVANMKALGNTSGSAASPQEVAILDENDMSTDSDTSLATQQSIKAYVDTTAAPTVGFTPTSYTGGESVTLPNGLIMKFGTVTVSGDTNTAVNFGAAFNATVSAQLTIEENTTTDRFPLKVASLSTSVLTIRNSQSDSLTAHWLAFGR